MDSHIRPAARLRAFTVTTALALTTAAAVTLGCASDEEPVGREAPPESEPAPSAPSAPGEPSTPEPSAPGEAANGSDIGACLDGTCEVTVSAPTGIPVDGRFGADSVSVSWIADGAVTER
ncbi:hypothetical protein [Streptomyces sp. MP131-18]|uniref:hypothetical protein n=1 Tax=Streptomyces sp. MP131-18 TaxID=1857892 RepID=UPI00097C5B92|nr:hypothetical protein [Streptomyces sp. MP131-18]ONK12785.1 hypothetical protein STBA_35380 [Streptomyces sp. MP131-18]